MGYSRRDLELLRVQLENERSSFISHWRDLANYILPRRPRFLTKDVNKGNKRHTDIIDSTAPFAARTLRSGMMGGITSPARPWFRLTTSGPSSLESGSLKSWLNQVTTDMYTVLAKSNFYNVIPLAYGDLGVFATAALFVEEDFETVLRFTSVPIGSYCISTNGKGIVNVFQRELPMTVRQIVDTFGEIEEGSGKILNKQIFSQHVLDMYANGNTEAWVDVCHFVIPNTEYDSTKQEDQYRRFLSVYYEKGQDEGKGFLRLSGYQYFPVLCPRWEVSGGDIYGTNCPGMAALGDIKQLQVSEKKIAMAIEKMVNPPMVGPTGLRNSKASILPGDITYLDVRDSGQGFRPAHEINARVGELEQKNEQVRRRIQRAFYEDLFLMMATSDRREITAREIDERHEEKLLALGPVLEQLNQDLLDPVIDILFIIMNRQGLIAPPPPEISESSLKVEYISFMAQAQKSIGVGAIERVSSFVGQLSQISQDVLDKLDADQTVDVYGDMMSIPPGVIRSDEEVEQIRQQRAQAAQGQQALAQMQQVAGVAQSLSKADTSGDNALAQLLGGAQ